MTNSTTWNTIPAANSTYKKLAVQWLNEVLCFVSSSVLAGSFRLRNRHLLVAAKRYVQPCDNQDNRHKVFYLNKNITN